MDAEFFFFFLKRKSKRHLWEEYSHWWFDIHIFTWQLLLKKRRLHLIGGAINFSNKNEGKKVPPKFDLKNKMYVVRFKKKDLCSEKWNWRFFFFLIFWEANPDLDEMKVAKFYHWRTTNGKIVALVWQCGSWWKVK